MKKSKRWLKLTCVALVGCAGYSLQASGISSTLATLNAQASCSASSTSNPCTSWFQYWKDGATTVSQTAHVVVNIATSGSALATQVTGLTPNTVYHYQLCGTGDTNIAPPGLCTGPLERGAFYGSNTPGTRPATGDFSLVSTFRTADASKVGTVDLGRVLTSADTSTTPISRDSGYSVLLSTNPPKSLWLFDDTQFNGGINTLGSAAVGTFTPGTAPQTLTELPTPPAAIPSTPPTAPAAFLPAPPPLLGKAGGACAAEDGRPSTWNMGAAKVPGTSRVLITYGELCVSQSFILLERVALADYDTATNRFLRVDRPFAGSPLNAEVPKLQRVGSPVFPGDGFVYFFVGFCAKDCGAGSAVYVARAGDSPASWSSAANYRWWTGTAWSSNPSAAQTVVANITPLGEAVQVADYSAANASRKYVMLAQATLGTLTFDTYFANSPTGPWTKGPSAQVPEQACSGGPLNSCYAIKGHPELSTATQLVYTWYSPDDRNGFGHIRVGAINW